MGGAAAFGGGGISILGGGGGILGGGGGVCPLDVGGGGVVPAAGVASVGDVGWLVPELLPCWLIELLG